MYIMAHTDTQKVCTQNSIYILCAAFGSNLRRREFQCLMIRGGDYSEICSMTYINTLVHSQNKGQQVSTNDFSHN